MTALLVVLAATATTLILAWAYFRRFRVSRPPAGIINMRDVSFFLVMVVAAPFLYLALPSFWAGALLVVVTVSTLSLTIQPVVRRTWVTAVAVVGLVGTDVALALTTSGGSRPFLLVNNVVLALVGIGIPTSGSRAV